MLSAQDDSGSSKKSRSGTRGRRSLGTILLGIALLACALLLFLYYQNNKPQRQTIPNSYIYYNINRPPPVAGADPTRPPPSPAAPASNQLNGNVARQPSS